MVISSVLWMEELGLGLARNIVQRYALEEAHVVCSRIEAQLAKPCSVENLRFCWVCPTCSLLSEFLNRWMFC
jgi:hypothetical protein